MKVCRKWKFVRDNLDKNTSNEVQAWDWKGGVPLEAPELGLPFRIVPNWGKR